jgi:hypothetical protein
VNFSFSTSYIALWVLVIFQSFVLLALLQQIEKLRRVAVSGRLFEDHLPQGSRAPEFANIGRPSVHRFGTRSLEGSGGVLLFLSSDCLACKGLVNNLGQSATDDLPPIVVFCVGRERGCARFENRLITQCKFVVDGAAKTAARYRISNFPTAVVLDRELKISRYGHIKDVAEIKELWSSGLSKRSHNNNESKQVYSTAI